MLSHLSLIVKHRAELPKRVGDALSQSLKTRGITVTEGSVNPKSDAVVVLGGDGTLLHVAGEVYRLGLPLLGINLGGLGFLTEIHLDEMEQALDALLSGVFDVDRRMMISINILRKEKREARYYALNEAVVTKGPLGKIIMLPTWAGGSFLTTYRGDGLILSTPTGSTAYNLSAGGPILHPNLEALVLTPICPFALSARPLILPGATTVEVRLSGAMEETSLVIDGQVGHELQDGDLIRVERAEGHLKLVRSPLRDYFTILREKLEWAKGMGQ
jgi:NAD+ kinase